MFQIDLVAMHRFKVGYEAATIRRLALEIKARDPASAGGRALTEVEVFVRRAAVYAKELGMSSQGLVALMATWAMLCADIPGLFEQLRPLFSILLDTSRTEDDRFEEIQCLMYDLDFGLPLQLRRNDVSVVCTAETKSF